MNFIVFDLELTCWQGDPAGRMQEIIEIGAYKVDSWRHTKSKFNRFIKPKLFPVLSPFCVQLTSISQSQIDKAKSFKHVMHEFMEWSEFDIEPHHLIAWGEKDQSFLIENSKLHQIEYEWINPYTDLKKQYQQVKRLYEPRGLKHATESEGLEFNGTQHRAIDDAYNLCRIFLKYFDEWNLHKEG